MHARTSQQRSFPVVPVAAGCAGLAAIGVWAVRRHRMRFDFKDKVVLITGGSRGLGLVLARMLIAEGARVCICARHGDELALAADELTKAGGDVLAIECDVANADAVREMVRWIEHHRGPIDVLINNAGVIRVGPLETMTTADFEYMHDVHVRGPLNTIQAVLPSMRQRGGGRIANISSIGGLFPAPHLTAYCASKFALVGLSQGLRMELAKDGVYVTTVCPGLMRTGSFLQAEFKGQHRREFAWFSAGSSLPVVTESAERAARATIAAIRYGKGRVSPHYTAKAAAITNAMMPGVASWVFGMLNRVLPGPGGIGTRTAKGYASRSPWSPSFLTALGERAARRNNELHGKRTPRFAEAPVTETLILQEETQWTEM